MVTALRTRPTAEGTCSDGELITRTWDGDEQAYAELYRRHVKAARAAAWCITRSSTDTDDVVGEAFTQILSVLRRGYGPQEAFRPYLLTCVRNACSARARDRRTVAVDPTEMEASCGPSEREDQASWVESRLMEKAFYSLPERWQTVLWQTEVEGRRPSDVSRDLDLAPGAVAALSYRARKALAEAYLEAHVSGHASRSCQSTVHHLPGAVRGTLATRDRRKVEAHLATCDSCRAAESELQDLNRGLRNVLVLAVAGIPAAAYLARKGVPTLLRRLAAAKLLSGPAAASVAAVVTLPLLVPSAAPAAGPGPGSGRSSTATAAAAPAAREEVGVDTLAPARPVVPSTGSRPNIGPVAPIAEGLLNETWGALALLDLFDGVDQTGSDALAALQGVLDSVVASRITSAVPAPPVAVPPRPGIPRPSPVVVDTVAATAAAAPVPASASSLVTELVSVPALPPR